MSEGGGARGRNLVLPPLRRQLPARPAGQMARGARRRYLQAAPVALRGAHPGYRHLVGGVAVCKVVAKIEGCFAPRPLLPLRAVGHGAPVGSLGRVETGLPRRPVSSSKLVDYINKFYYLYNGD